MKPAWLLLAIACTVSAATEEESKMTSLPTAELMAMKVKNEELRFENFFLLQRISSLTDKIDEQDKLIASFCGSYIHVDATDAR